MTLNEAIEEIEKRAEVALDVTMTYDECVQLWFKNKFRSDEVTQLAMFMWPGHDFEDTKEVEDSYEATGKLFGSAKSDIPKLIRALKLATSQRDKYISYYAEYSPRNQMLIVDENNAEILAAIESDEW